MTGNRSYIAALLEAVFGALFNIDTYILMDFLFVVSIQFEH